MHSFNPNHIEIVGAKDGRITSEIATPEVPTLFRIVLFPWNAITLRSGRISSSGIVTDGDQKWHGCSRDQLIPLPSWVSQETKDAIIHAIKNKYQCQPSPSTTSGSQPSTKADSPPK